MSDKIAAQLVKVAKALVGADIKRAVKDLEDLQGDLWSIDTKTQSPEEMKAFTKDWVLAMKRTKVLSQWGGSSIEDSTEELADALSGGEDVEQDFDIKASDLEADIKLLKKVLQKHKIYERILHPNKFTNKGKSASARTSKELVGASFGIGKTIETGNLRMQRWMHSIRVWDLTNAGKRGKRVDVIAIYDLDYAERNNLEGMVTNMASDLSKAKTFAQAKKIIEKAAEEINDALPNLSVGIEERDERGVDVAPGDFKKIKIDGKHVFVQADFKSFTVRDRDDMANEPTCIPATSGGKADVKVFHRWVQDNESKIKGMTFSEVMQGMTKAGVRYHYYCAVD